MQNTQKPVMAIAIALLAIGIVAAPTAAADPTFEVGEDDCPVVAILLYAPYVSVRPECLPFGGN